MIRQYELVAMQKPHDLLGTLFKYLKDALSLLKVIKQSLGNGR